MSLCEHIVLSSDDSAEQSDSIAQSAARQVFASSGYRDGAAGAFAVYEERGCFYAEQLTGDPQMPAVYEQI